MSIKKMKKPLGDDLLSQGVAPQVPSALTGLTTGFGMLPGVPPSQKSPRGIIHDINKVQLKRRKGEGSSSPHHRKALDH
jgi:hypothetical protein